MPLPPFRDPPENPAKFQGAASGQALKKPGPDDVLGMLLFGPEAQHHSPCQHLPLYCRKKRNYKGFGRFLPIIHP